MSSWWQLYPDSFSSCWFDFGFTDPCVTQLNKCSPFFVGDCLLDQPSKPVSLPEDLPGASYTLSQQCELAFGVGSKPCPYMQYCTKLWCTGKAKGQMVCQTRHFPWADGTSCGEGKFCLKGACVERHNPNKYKVSTGACAVGTVSGAWGRLEASTPSVSLTVNHVCTTPSCCLWP